MQFSLFSITGLILFAVFFLAGVIDSISGGGGLITVPAMMAVGVPVPLLAGTNQCSVMLGSFTAALKYAQSRKIHWPSGLMTVPFALIGSVFGSRLNMFLPVSILEVIMLVMIPIMAVLMLFNRDFGEISRVDTLSKAQMLLRSAMIGLLIGGYQGFYGPGGGMLFMLGFALLMRLDMLHASGTARLIGACASVSATISYALSGKVVWELAALATVANISGNYIGSCLAVTKGSRIIRPLLYVVIVLLLVRIIFK